MRHRRLKGWCSWFVMLHCTILSRRLKPPWYYLHCGGPHSCGRWPCRAIELCAQNVYSCSKSWWPTYLKMLCTKPMHILWLDLGLQVSAFGQFWYRSMPNLYGSRSVCINKSRPTLRLIIMFIIRHIDRLGLYIWKNYKQNCRKPV